MSNLRVGVTLMSLLLFLGIQGRALPAHAQASISRGDPFFSATHLIEVTQNTPMSLRVRNLKYGGYESSGGSWIGFENWYSPVWQDTRVSWMTQFNRNFGLIWGLSTGEVAQKYTIDPGLRLGFIFQTQVHKSGSLAVSASTILGGQLREKSCVADYGQIGGKQEVNCRLAASVLQPSATLGYLLSDRPGNSIRLHYRVFFD